jgi:hypothetical protein
MNENEMEYPKVFKMSELLKLDLDVLIALEDSLYADWTRVKHAVEVVTALEGEGEE